MVEKSNIEWPSNFSIAGRNSIQKYPVLSRKANPKTLSHQNLLIKDLFHPDDSIINLNNEQSTEENITIINPYEMNNNNNSSNNKQFKTISPKQTQTPIHEDKLKYHNQHINQNKTQIKKHNEPTCTKYNPNMNCIWAKTNSGPQWKTICGRIKHISFDEKDFYINHEDISKTNKKVYIDMCKQTMRNGFPNDKDVRVRYEKKFKSNSLDSNINKKRISSTILQQSLTNKHISSSSISYHSPKFSSFQLVPDFNKTLSRDKLIKLEQRNTIDVPYHSPDDRMIKDRTIMMVLYNKKRFRHNKNNKNSKLKLRYSTPEAPYNYNIDKIYNKINNHEHPIVPNFDHMTARPEGKGDPLPSFMKGIHSRASSFMTTNKTLKLNNYAHSNYLSQYSSFFPKRSYNKNINLALLNSDKMDLKLVDNKSDFFKLANFVKKLSRMYKKNIDALIKDNNYFKFDNITFKHVDHGKKLRREKHLKDFIINLQKAEFM